MQKRIGPAEMDLVNISIKLILRYRILPQDHARKETFFNHLLFRHVAQTIKQATNKDIHSVGLISETFRPEFFVKGSKRFPLFCVECKKITDATAKSRFKEGLSQALVYSTDYKCVLLVFYDFTKDARFSRQFKGARRAERRLIDTLWEWHKIRVIFVNPN